MEASSSQARAALGSRVRLKPHSYMSAVRLAGAIAQQRRHGRTV